MLISVSIFKDIRERERRSARRQMYETGGQEREREKGKGGGKGREGQR